MSDELDGRVITGSAVRTSAGIPRQEITGGGLFHIDRQGNRWMLVGNIYDEGKTSE